MRPAPFAQRIISSHPWPVGDDRASVLDRALMPSPTARQALQAAMELHLNTASPADDWPAMRWLDSVWYEWCD